MKTVAPSPRAARRGGFRWLRCPSRSAPAQRTKVPRHPKTRLFSRAKLDPAKSVGPAGNVDLFGGKSPRVRSDRPRDGATFRMMRLVLFVDDSPLVRAVMSLTLTELGFEVVSKTSA